MEHRLQEPFTKEQVKHFKAGDRVLVTGTIYTARDAAHKRIVELLQNGEEPPFDIENSIVYYVGPTPAKPGHPIGSAGPTTSYRMDAYAPILLDLGQLAMIGKGQRGRCAQRSSVSGCDRRGGGTHGQTDQIGRSHRF